MRSSILCYPKPMTQVRSNYPTQKLSISLPSNLLNFAEDFKVSHGLESRSEVIARALELLLEQELRQAYRDAAAEWEASPDAKLWENTVGDGIEKGGW